MGLGGLKPPKEKYSPPNEMKPINPFWLGLMFFARFVSKKMNRLQADFFGYENFWLKLQPKLAPPN